MIGEDTPVTHRVVVRDTFQQYKLRMAAQAIGMQLPQFFLFCAEYVVTYHRDLKCLRAIFRRGAREIRAAAAEPIPPGALCPESERNRRRRVALDFFATWAGRALHEEITGEKL